MPSRRSTLLDAPHAGMASYPEVSIGMQIKEDNEWEGRGGEGRESGNDIFRIVRDIMFNTIRMEEVVHFGRRGHGIHIHSHTLRKY